MIRDEFILSFQQVASDAAINRDRFFGLLLDYICLCMRLHKPFSSIGQGKHPETIIPENAIMRERGTT